ncbi:UPF0175 family protein [Rubrivirga sp.]|uniref:UPF0175 family protein n=1 Tax=Rubrivirga sp. TaxID=1885344 RepID=UPI003B516CD1
MVRSIGPRQAEQRIRRSPRRRGDGPHRQACPPRERQDERTPYDAQGRWPLSPSASGAPALGVVRFSDPSDAAMTLDLPPSIDEARARLVLAIGLFQEDALTVGRAAEVAGLSYRDFLEVLRERGIPALTLSFDESDVAFVEAFKEERGLP